MRATTAPLPVSRIWRTSLSSQFPVRIQQVLFRRLPRIALLGGDTSRRSDCVQSRSVGPEGLQLGGQVDRVVGVVNTSRAGLVEHLPELVGTRRQDRDA